MKCKKILKTDFEGLFVFWQRIRTLFFVPLLVFFWPTNFASATRQWCNLLYNLLRFNTFYLTTILYFYIWCVAYAHVVGGKEHQQRLEMYLFHLNIDLTFRPDGAWKLYHFIFSTNISPRWGLNWMQKSLRIDFEGLFIYEKEVGKFVYTSLKKLSEMSKIIKFYPMD